MAKAFMITVSSVFSNVPPFFTKLSKLISGDMDCSHLAIVGHSTDGSPYAITPQAILYPKTTTDIKHAISFAREYHIPLTACGGLTAQSGGALGEGIIIDMTRYFSHIRHVNMLEHTVTVDAGVRIDDLREKLASWNLEIPVLQQEFSAATIGGLVATKSATSSTFYTGSIREWIEGLTIVVDSGEEHHIRDGITPSGRLLGVYQSIFPLLGEHGPTLRAARRESSDDATGYSLWNTQVGPRQLLDQLVGSEGTLAIITSVTLRVTQKKKHEHSCLIPIPDASLLATHIDIAQHHQAERLFMFDAAFRKLSDTFHSRLIDPAVPMTPYFLLVTFRHDSEEHLASIVKTFIKALPDPHTEAYPMYEKDVEKLQSSAFLTSLFRDYSGGTHMVATAGNGIIVPLHSYGDCVAKLDEFLGNTGRLYTLTGFAGSGHIAVHASIDAQSYTYETDLQEFREKLFSVIRGFKAGISAVSGDGLERTAALQTVYNEAARKVFKFLKDAWDPLSIFNPSKKIAITKDYLITRAIRGLP